ncbi:MAG TPA: hypothetical protein VFV28_10350, partial [Limnobacter sp.]|nr:hypothetical protein [Limnobacter sp.]
MESMFTEHQQLMGQLKSRHSEILQLIDGRPVHLLDIPVYGNVGDLLILKGTQQFLKDNRVKVVQIASIHNFRDS